MPIFRPIIHAKDKRFRECKHLKKMRKNMTPPPPPKKKKKAWKKQKRWVQWPDRSASGQRCKGKTEECPRLGADTQSKKEAYSERARRTHRASPQEPSTMVPKCTLGCPEHNLSCSPDSHLDALELQPFVQGYPLAFTRALTERRTLVHHLNHLYIIVLWHNGPNVL